MWEPRMRVGRKLKDTHAGALYTGHTPPENGNHAVTHSHGPTSSHTRSCRVAANLSCGTLWHRTPASSNRFEKVGNLPFVPAAKPTHQNGIVHHHHLLLPLRTLAQFGLLPTNT